MTYFKNVVEYYDELYPVTVEQRNFYTDLVSQYRHPAKCLGVGCGTGLLEHQLARQGIDITGIEDTREFINTANLRRRTQLMSLRFFEMSPLDMTKFLGKKFYDVISTLNDRICTIKDETLRKKFFYDCRELLRDDGVVVVQFTNINKFSGKGKFNLPTKESLRVKLHAELEEQSNGNMKLSETVETGSGKILPVVSGREIYPLTTSELEKLALEAGFSKVEFFSDFNKRPFTGKEDTVVALVS